MKTNNELLRRIARYLMLHGSFSCNIGLLNGKTGIAIFFYHYAAYTGRKVYRNFANELIDEIYAEIHRDLACNFKDGFCGIAWGIEYLIKNNFVKTDADDVLEELDNRIIEWDVRRITDYSLETGLIGIGCYAVSRMANKKNKNSYISSDYLCSLMQALTKKQEEVKAVSLLIHSLEKIVNNEKVIHFYDPVFEIVDECKYNSDLIFESPRLLGISGNGYVGVGLQLMEIGKQ